MKRRIRGLIFLIIMLLITACVAATPPVEMQNPKGVITYNATAIPTIFAKSMQTVPTVKLNWAYADPQLLKINITVTGLDANVNVEDFICDPYIVTKEAIQYSSPGREDVKHLTDQPGSPLEITYMYGLKAPIQYKTLDIDMVVTLGPCADYLNFQETNVTPTAIPDLIGNYNFNFQVPVRKAQ